MASNWREDLAKQYAKARQRIERQVQTQQQAVADAANRARTNLRSQLSGLERDAEAAINTIRKAEAMEQRKRDLPLTKPKDIQAKERIADLNRQRTKIQSDIARVRDDIAQAETEDLAAVERAESEAMSELADARLEVEREARKAEAEFNKAQAEAEKAYKAILDRPGEEVFEELVTAGQIPKDAKYVGYDKLSGEVEYELAGKAEDVEIIGFNPYTNNVKIEFKTGETEWRPESEFPKFAKLTEKQKKEVALTGEYTTEAPKVTVQQAFERLQNRGEIPKEAKLISTQSEFEKSRELIYQPSLDVSGLEKEFLAEPKLGQRNIVDAALERHTSIIGPIILMPPRLKYENLTSEKQREVLQYYSTLTGKEKVLGITISKSLEPSTKTIKGIVGMVPVIGTIALWDEMSPTWKGISVALDVLILAPFARAGVLALQRLRAPIKAGAVAVARQEAILTKQMVSKLSKVYGKKVGKEYATMMEAQNTYLKHLANIEELARRGKSTTKAVRLAEDSERNLIRIAKRFADDIRYKPGFDSPAVAKMMEGLPKEMALNTRRAIESLKSTKVSIKALEAEVAKAEGILKAAQAKWPTQPAKWSDLMVDHAIKQSKLATAKTGDVAGLQGKLVAARKAGRLKEAAQIEAKLHRAIKSMEIEWGRGGAISKGRGRIAVVEPFAPTVGAPIRIATVPTRLLPPAVAKLPLIRLIVVAPTKTYTIPLPEFLEMTASEIKSAYGTKLSIHIEGIPKEAIVEWASPEEMVKTAQKIAIETYTDVAIKAATEAATEAAIKAATEAEIKVAAKTAAETQVKAITKTAVRTAVRTRVATRLKIFPKLKLKLRPWITLPDGTKHTLTEKEIAGAVGWKQGFIYKLIFPPYGKNQIVNTKKPIAGIKYYEGARSAYKSIVRIGGQVPQTIERDMGIMDIRITTPRGKQPKIAFQPDIKQRTTLTRKQRRHKPQKRETEPMLIGARL